MASKTAVLSQLTRAELLSFVDSINVEVADRRVREQLVSALAGSRRASLPTFLTTFPRTRLKEIARKLGVDDGGREKAVIVEKLLNGTAKVASARGAASAALRSRAEPGAATPRKKPRAAVRIAATA